MEENWQRTRGGELGCGIGHGFFNFLRWPTPLLGLCIRVGWDGWLGGTTTLPLRGGLVIAVVALGILVIVLLFLGGTAALPGGGARCLTRGGCRGLLVFAALGTTASALGGSLCGVCGGICVLFDVVLFDVVSLGLVLVRARGRGRHGGYRGRKRERLLEGRL